MPPMDQGNSSTRLKPRGSGSAARFAARAGEWLFAFQRFVVKRFWTLIVLAIGSAVGAYAAGQIWGEQYKPAGRHAVFIILLLTGVVIFSISPKRGAFMKRLVFLLVGAGGAILGITFLVAWLGHSRDATAAWNALDQYFLTPLGWQWVFGGLGLAVVLWGGRAIVSKMTGKSGPPGTKPSKPVDKPAPRSDAPPPPAPAPPSPAHPKPAPGPAPEPDEPSIELEPDSKD